MLERCPVTGSKSPAALCNVASNATKWRILSGICDPMTRLSRVIPPQYGYRLFCLRVFITSGPSHLQRAATGLLSVADALIERRARTSRPDLARGDLLL